MNMMIIWKQGWKYNSCNDKATLWWEEIKTVQGVDEQEVTWEQFKKHFKDKYLTEWFYVEKEKEFHDLKLG